MGIINSILETLKLLAETITAISAAVVLILQILKHQTIKGFFFGIHPIDSDIKIKKEKKTEKKRKVKKVRFWKALGELERQKERICNIVEAIAPDRKNEYLLNKDELAKFLLDNKIFTKVTR